MPSRHGEHGPLRSIVIAEDHPLFREALKRMVEEEPDLELVAEATDGREALELCRDRRPELVLMDVRMPKIDGIAATRAIKRELPRTVVLVITAIEEPKLLAEALKAGAAGYVLKYANPRQLIEAIHAALSGESPLDQALAKRLLRELCAEETVGEGSAELAPLAAATETGEGGAPMRPLAGSLTPREAEILRLVAQGNTNQEVARSLRIGVSTVKKHVRWIISKLGVSDRTQAAVRASELGLLGEKQGE